jgi:SagB-type dehydrogenase family enzyme
MPSANRESERALRYHDLTAHSPQSVRASGHTLDWDVRPSPFKIYPDLPVVPLPQDLPMPAADTWQDEGTAARASRDVPLDARGLDLARLASVLFFSAGATRRRADPGGARVDFRAAASTGALYQTEVYVVAGDVAGLPPGVYHFGPADFALRRLRDGDVRGALASAAADDALAAAPAGLVLTGIYWRNAWKYQARAYRHLFWDSGTMLANLLAAASALGAPARLVTGFVDAEVNGLLGLDASREGALVLVALGPAARPAPAPPPITPLHAAVVPLSAREVDYPLVADAYADSSLVAEAEVLDWRERAAALGAVPGAASGGAPRSRLTAAVPPPPGAGTGRALLPLPPPAAASGRSVAEAIRARGSTREFSGAPIPAAELSGALHHAARGARADVPPGLVDLYLTVHAVDGIPPGAYAYHPGPHALEPLKAGDFRRESAFLCLEQPLGGMSSATVFFLADLGRVLDALGNRGYRVANLEAGIAGGRLYLSAYARRFGATGLTFYDRAVVDFFSPHAAGRAALFVTALGRSAAGRRSPVSGGLGGRR